MHSNPNYGSLAVMTPQQVFDYLDSEGISRGEFSTRLGITEAAISKWGRSGSIAYDRQCQIQLETKGKLKADWDHAPKDRREVRAA